MKNWPLSAMLTSLPLDFETAVRTVAELGFTHADIVALVERPEAHLEALADAGLLIGCASLGRGLPEGHDLDVADRDVRRHSVALVERQIADAAKLGATHVYLASRLDPSPAALTRFAEAVAVLTDFARGRMVQLCVEPIPGRALARADDTLAWLESSRLDNTRLLLDVGHCLISDEHAADVVRRAGPRLGYVHLDDNDGVGDLHWALFAGRLTVPYLQELLNALAATNYAGPLAFEFNPQLADPRSLLAEGKAVVEKLLAQCE